ncbi:uncharacterized protein L201_004204 [Kwoniella dendrophila CBS 6074]|uniref:Origin recognition complex subunit 5 C-terminal domain-containing protein n=1 Tax=Kwoniella dendrophila CBS 6074 TaxID=1295534 RepID=A0AAX4JWK3_9TREE
MNLTLETLLANPPCPSLVYLHHPHHSSASIIPSTPTSSSSSSTTSQVIIKIDAIEYNTPKLLLSGIMNKLYTAGGQSHIGEDEREIRTFDGFSQKFRLWWSNYISKSQGKGKGKVKTSSKSNGNTANVAHGIEKNGEIGGISSDEGVIIMITKAERLRLVLGNGWSLITRLAELTEVPVSVVLCSTMPWDHIRPIRGDAPEPVHVYLPPPTRDEILSELLPCSKHPLWPRFLDLILSSVLSICQPKIEELHYLSISLWPIYTSSLPPHKSMIHLADQSYPIGNGLHPEEIEITIKLLTDLKQKSSLSLASSIENLLPRLIGSHEFTKSFLPKSTAMDGISSIVDFGKSSLPKPPSMELTTVEKFLLVAGYTASYNPPKSDIRLFGRGALIDGKRKKGGGTRRTGYGRVRIGKVPQRLLGPKPFTLDRLLGLFSSLYTEHSSRPEELQATIGGESSGSSSEDNEIEDDWLPSIAQQSAKVERKRKREVEREKKWDDHVDELAMSVKVWGLIPQLESQGMLKRVSPQDRLDNIMLRCETDYETAKTISKELKIILDEYLYEAVM